MLECLRNVSKIRHRHDKPGSISRRHNHLQRTLRWDLGVRRFAASALAAFWLLPASAFCGLSEPVQSAANDPVATRIDDRDKLIEAAESANFKEVERLLDVGADQQSKNDALLAMSNSEPMMILLSPEEEKRIEAARRNFPQAEAMPMDFGKTARVLIEHGADVEAKREDGATPLVIAAGHGSTEVVRVLLEKGANVEAGEDGGTPLAAAACGCETASMPDTAESIKLLLAHKANVDAHGKDGKTPLMTAAGWGRTGNVGLFLDAGAKIDLKDAEGNAALIIAAAGSAMPTAETVKLLLEKGADIRARNNKGETALMRAASEGGYEDAVVVKILLDGGADVATTDTDGHTALDLAKHSNRAKIVAILEHGGTR